MGKKKKDRVRIRNQRRLDFVEGRLTVEDLDDEEIRRGQFRNKDGKFSGTKTNMVPMEFYDRLTKENIRRAERRFQELLGPAIDTLDQLHRNPRLPADARMKSAVFLVERAAGKTPERSEVVLEVAKWEEDIEGLLEYEGGTHAKGKRKREGPAKD